LVDGGGGHRRCHRGNVRWEGFTVILSAKSQGKEQKLAEQIKVKGYLAEAVRVDAGEPSCIAELIDSVIKKHGAMDVLHYITLRRGGVPIC
jgi:NAD(P)-dependent dehydrogenase (short-subunit alcohol dehydrogenase family)